MKQEWIEKADITNVYQKEFPDVSVISIHFTMHLQEYRLVIQNKEGIYVPERVFHHQQGPCLFCQDKKKDSYCSPLVEHRKMLFERLIEYPSIRLEWLYIPHG